MRTKFHAALLSLLTFSAFNPPHSLFAQGSLAPPGPPAPMFRTLEEVQPRRPIGTNTTPGDTNALFVISQPGSYYLTTNVTGVAGKHGILITASGVTLDLMGFELVGVPNRFGITTFFALSNIVVRNGTVRNWNTGFDTAQVRNGQYQDLRVLDNSGFGFYCGAGSTIVNCLARGNASTGISCLAGSVLTGCQVSANGAGGIDTQGGAATITACTALNNGGDGISGHVSSVVTGCTAQGNTIGIRVTLHSTVVSCAAGGNEVDGIVAEQSCNVSGCIANNNSLYGINVTEKCRVADNTCADNGNGGIGSGILSIGSKNRIENNHVVNNDGQGIWISAAGNLIMRNSASGNTTNYVIVAGNKVGPIVAAPSSGAISGDTGGAGVGTTDPWANFSY